MTSVPDPTNYNSCGQYELALKGAGWKWLGGGVAGEVYEHPNHPLVVKVFQCCDGYVAFAQYVVGNPKPLLPTPFNITHLTATWGVAQMERLDKLSPQNAARLNQWRDAYFSALRNKSSLPDPQEWSALAEDLRPIAVRGDGKNHYGFDMSDKNAMQRANGELVFTDPLN